MGEPLQTIRAGTDIFRNWSVIDANFDGYMDFTCTYLQGGQPYYNHLWIWNECHQRFDSVPEYDEISVPTLDAEKKRNGAWGYERGHILNHFLPADSGQPLFGELCIR